ncbi:multicopper oxidase domain-containing protein [Tenacibaculum amylolyticum]|uniref:multicopper oxidase domain-containing protein n=1 Tax=Tenacibaculum amylolyticum TaxID=104269 RepID=UPI0038950045
MHNISRRKFVVGMGASLAYLTLAQSCRFLGADKKALRLMPQLPEIDVTKGIQSAINLNLQRSKHNFGTQVLSDTYGINSNYLGPIVRVKKGQEVPFNLTNNLKEKVAIHWHGLHIPGHVDGGPHQAMNIGETWSPTLHINQRASMNWYHAHTHGHTAPQTYKGLAGMFIIEDDDSLSADIPKTNNVDDFVVVLQDKQFDKNGQIFLTKSNVNNSFLVNGVKGTVDLKVPKGLVRLRIINASNGAFMQLNLSNKKPLYVIASDGGFINKPVEVETMVISPAERFEVLIDCDQDEPFALESLRFDDETLKATPTNVIDNSTKKGEQAIVFYPTDEIKGFTGSMPKTLANIEAPKPELALRTRKFSLSQELSPEMQVKAKLWGNNCNDDDHVAMGINGRPMDMSLINEVSPMHEYEIWEVTAVDGGHPFHVHGCSFRIIEQMDQKPPEYASGWKDIMYANQNQTSKLLVKFDYEATEKYPYMYHCHILSHEDCGMMGQFTTGKNVTPFSADTVSLK